jgi:hypothetical protein
LAVSAAMVLTTLGMIAFMLFDVSIEKQESIYHASILLQANKTSITQNKLNVVIFQQESVRFLQK